ncbi:pyruvate carboxyltransferase [Pelosinus sp. sgz500959]|uniref:homocitrate synthase/isopropylmalate synthase family protein n=1 Tax=Pelosinus sp. sgz500959 TaxID=3242472 RepID=UPI00366E5EE6
MIWVDQTLNEGLRIGMDKGNIEKLLDLLQELQLGMIDCRVIESEKYDWAFSNKVTPVQVRGIIHATVEDVKFAHELGFTNIMLTYAPISGKEITDRISDSLLAAQKFNMNIALCIENASHFSIEELEGLWRELPTAEAMTFVYGDGESLLNPLSTFKILSELIARLSVPVEFHGHNAYGLATANALGAMQAGVKGIGVSVAGVGQYGHAALEELIMAQKCLFVQEIGETGKLASICSQVLAAIGVVLPKTKAIIGEDIFAHESGIHVDGVMKNPQLYESFSPEDVGASRKIIIGKHSGTASILAKFKQWDVLLTAIEAQYLLKEVRRRAVLYKKSVDDDMLWQLYQGQVV